MGKPSKSEIATALLVAVVYLPFVIFYEIKWKLEKLRGLK